MQLQCRGRRWGINCFWFLFMETYLLPPASHSNFSPYVVQKRLLFDSVSHHWCKIKRWRNGEILYSLNFVLELEGDKSLKVLRANKAFQVILTVTTNHCSITWDTIEAFEELRHRYYKSGWYFFLWLQQLLPLFIDSNRNLLEFSDHINLTSCVGCYSI